MTEEIKEILYLQNYVDKYKSDEKAIIKGNRLTTPAMLDYLEVKSLLNYITNLQKENEKYKKIFEAKERFSKIMPDDTDFIILSKADYDRQQEDIELTAIKLKSRNEKAIEYIENDLQISVLPNNQIINGKEVVKRINKIVNILQGGDE